MRKSTFVLMFCLAAISWLYSVVATIFIVWTAFAAYREGSLFSNGGVLFAWIVFLVIGYALLRGACWLITWLWVAIFERQPRTDQSVYDLLPTKKPLIGKRTGRAI